MDKKPKKIPIMNKRPNHLLRAGTALAVGAALCVTPPNARAQIFVESHVPYAPTSIVGAYNLDGSAINSSLITGLPANWTLFNSLGVYSNNLYVVGDFGGGLPSVGKYTTSGTSSGSFAGTAGWNAGFTMNAGILYCANPNGNTVGSYNATNGAAINTSLISSGLYSPHAPVISGSHLYIANAGNGTVGEYNLDGSVVNAALISGLTQPSALSVANGYLYVSSLGVGGGNLGKVGEYDATTGTPINAALLSGLGGGPPEIAVVGNDLYITVAVTGGSDVAVYNATSGNVINSSLISGLGGEIQGFVVSVPEPSTLALSALGSLTLFWPLRRRK